MTEQTTDALFDVIRRARSDAYTALCERWGDRDAGHVSAHDEVAHMDRAALLAALGHDDCVPREACPCCGEPIAPTWPDGEYGCACEWEGCDENCPVVGDLYMKARAERAEADRHPGCTCPFTGDAPAMHHDYCAAHYGGERHYNCVPRDEYDADVNMRVLDATEQYRHDAEQQYDRAERAEAERDTALGDLDAVRHDLSAAQAERDQAHITIRALLTAAMHEARLRNEVENIAFLIEDENGRPLIPQYVYDEVFASIQRARAALNEVDQEGGSHE